jgi:hypothetical protein
MTDKTHGTDADANLGIATITERRPQPADTLDMERNMNKLDASRLNEITLIAADLGDTAMETMCDDVAAGNTDMIVLRCAVAGDPRYWPDGSLARLLEDVQRSDDGVDTNDEANHVKDDLRRLLDRVDAGDSLAHMEMESKESFDGSEVSGERPPVPKAEHLPISIDRMEDAIKRMMDAMPEFDGGVEIVEQLAEEMAFLRLAAREACRQAEIPWISKFEQDFLRRKMEIHFG